MSCKSIVRMDEKSGSTALLERLAMNQVACCVSRIRPGHFGTPPAGGSTASVAKDGSVGRLAGGVAHDFNNLLTVIHGYCEVLQSHLTVGSDSRFAVDAILNAAERATQLTRQLLAFSRKAMLEPRTLNLNEVVSQMEVMLRRLIAAHISIEIDLEPSPCFIEADATQLDQVILNLALNARDAMPDGGHLRIATKLLVANTEEEKFAGLKQGAIR